MGVFLFLSPPVHCGQLLKEAVADESKFGELIKPYFQKEMAGRPHVAQRPQPPGLWGSDGSVWGSPGAGGGVARPGDSSWEMDTGFSCLQRLCICFLAGPFGFWPCPKPGASRSVVLSLSAGVFLFLGNVCFS